MQQRMEEQRQMGAFVGPQKVVLFTSLKIEPYKKICQSSR